MSPADDSMNAMGPPADPCRVLFSSLTDLILCMLDGSGRFLTWNPALLEVAGYPAAEIIGQHLGCLYRPADRAAGKPARDLKDAMSQGRLEDVGWRVSKDGSEFWASSIITVITDPDGRNQGFVLRLRDISAQRQSEEVLRSVLDHVLDGIVTVDDQGLIQSFNPAAESIFEYNAAEALGQNVNILMPDPHRTAHSGYMERYLRGGEARIIGIGREVTGCRRDGSTFPMDLAVSQFRLRGRVYFTGIVRDITERKRLEQELRRRITELAETDRRKDEFLAMLAHELRNPLAAISNAVQLTGQFADPQQSEWSAQVINRQVKHLARLIEDLLDVSRITRGKIQLRKEVIDIARVISIAAQNVQPLMDERKHQMSISAATGTMWVDADPTRLEQVFTNLLNNAAKYTEEAGTICLTAVREGQNILVTIRDNGIGIPAEKLSQVFELFAQGDRSLARQEGGLGIGLTLARSLAELHGGSLIATSAGPGKGSEFTLGLPATEKPIAKADSAAPEAAAFGGGCRVLVVDDNLELALGLARLLKLLGHDVRIAHDGSTALDVARAFQPAVILLDIGLPGLDGYQVAMTLREEELGQHTRIIAITGYGYEDDRKRSLEAGFDDHLVKPIEFRSLIALLAESPPGL